MKIIKCIIVLFIICNLQYKLQSQKLLRPTCGHKQVMHQIKENIPNYVIWYSQYFKETKYLLKERTPVKFRIPVVFHIIWNTNNPIENIPDSCLYRQIEIMNEAFAAKNKDFNQIRAVFGLSPLDAEIEFYIADKNPTGAPAIGIVRKQTSKKFLINLLSGGLNIDMKSTSRGGDNPWDVTKYYNIWVVNMPINFLGTETISLLAYSTPPPGLVNWPANALDGVGADGTVVQFQFVGDNNETFSQLGPEYEFANKGKTLIHETGHFLGLRHTWADKGDIFGGASCVNAQGEVEDDGMNDTPYCGSNSQTTGCDENKNTCDDPNGEDKPDMWENYMDYSQEQCQVVFTVEQINFMRNVIQLHRNKLTSWDQVSIKEVNTTFIDIKQMPSNHQCLVSLHDINSQVKIRLINIDGRICDEFYLENEESKLLSAQANQVNFVCVFLDGKLIETHKIIF